MKLKILLNLFLLSIVLCSCESEEKNTYLKILLGKFPDPPKISLHTLEIVELEKGRLLRIRYLSEPADSIFEEPVDYITAYLFVPEHQRQAKLPAIVAIHQDGSNLHLGKLEPVGLAGSQEQHYGLELFNRGYVVICPDRYYHAERRRLVKNDSSNIDIERDLKLADFRTGQLIMKGRTMGGEMAYDLSRSVDVLESLDFVDRNSIGTIGH